MTSRHERIAYRVGFTVAAALIAISLVFVPLAIASLLGAFHKPVDDRAFQAPIRPPSATGLSSRAPLPTFANLPTFPNSWSSESWCGSYTTSFEGRRPNLTRSTRSRVRYHDMIRAASVFGAVSR